MQWMNDFAEGTGAAFRGIAAFYRDRSLLRYALLPLAVTAAVYLLLGWGAHWAGRHVADILADFCAALPEYLRWLAGVVRFTVMLTTALLFGMVIAVTVSTLYELFGWLFFDRMITEFERKHFGRTLPEKGVAFTLQFLRDSCFYGLGTLFCLVLTALAGLFLPFLGQLAAIALVGFRLGVTYLAAAGYNDRKTLSEIRFRTAQHRMATAGFGITAYLLTLIPFALIFLLPGLVLGGVLLYRSSGMDGSQGSVYPHSSNFSTKLKQSCRR